MILKEISKGPGYGFVLAFQEEPRIGEELKLEGVYKDGEAPEGLFLLKDAFPVVNLHFKIDRIEFQQSRDPILSLEDMDTSMFYKVAGTADVNLVFWEMQKAMLGEDAYVKKNPHGFFDAIFKISYTGYKSLSPFPVLTPVIDDQSEASNASEKIFSPS